MAGDPVVNYATRWAIDETSALLAGNKYENHGAVLSVTADHKEQRLRLRTETGAGFLPYACALWWPCVRAGAREGIHACLRTPARAHPLPRVHCGEAKRRGRSRVRRGEGGGGRPPPKKMAAHFFLRNLLRCT